MLKDPMPSHLIFERSRNYDGLPALFQLLATVLRQACHVFLKMVLQQLVNLQQQHTTPVQHVLPQDSL